MNTVNVEDMGVGVSKPVISVEHLKTSFFTKRGEAKAVDDVSYEIHHGQTLGIVGESGCGKSVTSLSIMRLLEPPGRTVGGAIKLHGQNLLELSEEQMQSIRGRRVAMIFQEPMTALNPVLTIGYQISEQIIRHLKLPPLHARERAIEMLNLVGIPSPQERYEQYPHQLSGGMRQRAMIAMALSCEPDFLIADEPTTALDVTIQAQILELLLSLQEKFNMTVQFITHDLGVISEIADHVMVMYAGHTVETATTHKLFTEPRHPYTAALLNSIPRLNRGAPRLPTIDGSVPPPLSLPPGCPFQNRCPRATSRCLTEMPALFEMGSDHRAACHHPIGS